MSDEGFEYPGSGLFHYPIPFPGRDVPGALVLPKDMTAAEAERVIAMVRALIPECAAKPLSWEESATVLARYGIIQCPKCGHPAPDTLPGPDVDFGCPACHHVWPTPPTYRP
jgi:hypothetical protein